jgi:aspartate racemase
MAHVGIVGGLSPESTAEYYLGICRGFNRRKGGLEFPDVTVRSVSLGRVARLQEAGEWEAVGAIIVKAIGDLARAGADFAAIASNTPHNAFARIRRDSPLPVLSIMDAVADEAGRAGLSRLGLLGTRPTMECGVFREAFARRGIALEVPPAQERALVDSVIFGELVRGEARPESGREFARIIRGLGERGAQGVVLGCTEIGLLVKQGDSPVRLLDSAAIHADAVLECALDEAAFRRLAREWEAGRLKRAALK